MEREIFTLKNIKSDLYRRLISELLIIPPIFLSSLVIALSIYAVNELSNKNFNFKIYYIVVLILIFFSSLKTLINLIKTATTNFYIDSDTMIEYPGVIIEKKLKKYKFNIQRPTRRTGYNITHYHWSRKNNMDYWDYYRTSKVNDEFYVITFDKRKAYYIYNKNFFKYIDD